MISNKKIALYALLWMSTHHAMETPMTSIKEWDDIKPFAGRIVAYKLHSNNNLDTLHYGYAHKNPHYDHPGITIGEDNSRRSHGSAYTIHSLEKHTISRTLFPFNSMLQKTNLQVRSLSSEDKKYIKESLRNRTMRFPDIYGINKDELIDIVLSLTD